MMRSTHILCLLLSFSRPSFSLVPSSARLRPTELTRPLPLSRSLSLAPFYVFTDSRLRDQLITVAFSDQIAPRQSLPDPKPRPTPPPAAPFPPPSSTQREYSSRGAVFDSQASVRETDPKSGLSATSGSSKRREQKRAREKEEAAVRRRNSDGSSLRYPGLGTGGDGMTDW